ncbi:MAG: peroxide stress protein YaaA [Cypionkella sp.]|uniref:peroxide stress protein YaaA n=2 Tax=Cypionkella sp. TaxID=2811411 RepID=UPI002ABA42D8|nr:peroxide stress protein YaaA [Cypionkella sp.]MDZ4309100.1 peroxide stress protein YaaA [Cypionkella sp.]
MLTVISPAKRLNETPHPGDFAPSVPDFAADAVRLAKVARGLSVQDLCALMDISPALGQLNRDRFNTFQADAAGQPAAFMFDGDTYAGLEARRMEPDTLLWAQGHLRILSGLYGLLRPLDAIQPYRLEMGSRLANPKGADLYAYWGHKIAKALNALATEQEAKVLINCASAEYFGAVDLKALKLRVVTPVFLEERDGAAKIVSFWAKKARGAMARFICQHHLTDPADLRGFDLGGYGFRAAQSDATRLVFSRNVASIAA